MRRKVVTRIDTAGPPNSLGVKTNLISFGRINALKSDFDYGLICIENLDRIAIRYANGGTASRTAPSSSSSTRSSC